MRVALKIWSKCPFRKEFWKFKVKSMQNIFSSFSEKYVKRFLGFRVRENENCDRKIWQDIPRHRA
jgi:hypothetical protein